MRRNQLFGLLTAMRFALTVTLCVCTLHPVSSRAEKTAVVVEVTTVHDYLMFLPLMINGTGPYQFVVDTGSSITLVDERLFRDLHLVATGQQPMTGIVLDGKQPRTVLQELSVAGLSVKELSVVGVRNLMTAFPSTGRRIDGVLGEDFLSHYDLWIDNQAGTITFDTGGELALQLDGARIPMSNESHIGSAVYRHRPMVNLSVPSYSQKPIEALLDSGAPSVVLLPRDTGHVASRFGNPAIATSITVLGGTVPCASWQGQLRSDHLSLGDHKLTVCRRPCGRPLDNEGSLPTALFRSLFIAHRQGFVIVNPEKRTTPRKVDEDEVATESAARSNSSNTGNAKSTFTR